MNCYAMFLKIIFLNIMMDCYRVTDTIYVKNGLP